MKEDKASVPASVQPPSSSSQQVLCMFLTLLLSRTSRIVCYFLGF